MNTPALLKSLLFVGGLGLVQGYHHYSFALGNLALTSEQQKARLYELCMQELNPYPLAEMPSLWTRKREHDAARDCHTKVYEGRVWQLGKSKPAPTRFKLDGHWYYANGRPMVNSREGCLAILNDARKWNQHGRNPAYEAHQKANCDELYTEAEDKRYPKDTP